MSKEYRHGFVRIRPDGNDWMPTRNLMEVFCRCVEDGAAIHGDILAIIARAFRVALHGGSIDRELGISTDRAGRPPRDETPWPLTVNGKRDYVLAHNAFIRFMAGDALESACASAADEWNLQHPEESAPKATPGLAMNAWKVLAMKERSRLLPMMVAARLARGLKLNEAYLHAANEWNRSPIAVAGAVTASPKIAGYAFRKWPYRDAVTAGLTTARQLRQKPALSVLATDDAAQQD